MLEPKKRGKREIRICFDGDRLENNINDYVDSGALSESATAEEIAALVDIRDYIEMEIIG